ncbi:MAG: SIMPL domain-containing protein [Candidatus Woesearchaeota archaeon]
MKIINGLFILSLMALLVLGVGCQTFTKNTDTINVAGHADMTVAPDLAKVYAGISILKPTAVEAQTEADRIVSTIIDGLRYKGISERDIETETLNLYEEKEWSQKGLQVSMGWRATQTLKIKTNDLTKVGDIVDVIVQSRGNKINSIEFYLSTSKDDESKQLVLATATQNAKKKAQTMADNLGVKLDKIVSASESNYGYVSYKYTMANNMGLSAVQESAKVMPSDVTVSADMTLVYSIKQ